MTRRIPLFLRCSRREIAAIAARAPSAVHPAGAAIVTEGDESREFFVVLEGRVNVTQAATTLRELGPGDFFGEIAILAGGPRTATVTALTEVTALVVAEETLRELLGEMPVLRRKVAAALADRIDRVGI